MTAQNRVKGLIELRECVRRLIEYQAEDYPENDIGTEQAKLNRLYDGFTKKYGLINSRGNSMAFGQDSAYCLLCSLEIIDENGELERKADMFYKRTIKPHIPVTHVDTASEALSVSMSEKARVDLDYMAELTGQSRETLIKELEGVIFLNVGAADSQDKTYVTADEYLSGNVREKLVHARTAQAALGDGSLDINVSALEAAIPPDLTAAEISVRLGATWLPEEVIQKFMYELLQTSGYARDRTKVHYSDRTGEWSKQLLLPLHEGSQTFEVLSVGVDQKFTPTVTILKNGESKCFRLPNELSEWACSVVGIAAMGTNIFPTKVTFSNINENYYIDVL